MISFFLVYMSTVFKNFLKFLCSFIVCIRDFIKKFYKTMVFFFKKNWDIWNPEFQHNSIVYYFFFIFLSFLAFFFYLTYPNSSKNYGIFCNVLLEGVEILSTNSGHFQKFFYKNTDMWNNFFFQSSAVYYLFFYYFIIFYIFFSILSVYL